MAKEVGTNERQGVLASARRAGSGASLNNRDDFIRDSFERLGTEHANFRCEKALVRREELGGPRIADQPKATVRKIVVREFHGASVRIRLARDLTKNPVAALRIGQHHRRTALGLRQIRKRERNEDYLACCRCAHAVSSSGRFQSSARDVSLRRAVSWASEGSSVKIVTSARWRRLRWRGSSRRTAPCSSTMASRV